MAYERQTQTEGNRLEAGVYRRVSRCLGRDVPHTRYGGLLKGLMVIRTYSVTYYMTIIAIIISIAYCLSACPPICLLRPVQPQLAPCDLR